MATQFLLVLAEPLVTLAEDIFFCKFQGVGAKRDFRLFQLLGESLAVGILHLIHIQLPPQILPLFLPIPHSCLVHVFCQ